MNIIYTVDDITNDNIFIGVPEALIAHMESTARMSRYICELYDEDDTNVFPAGIYHDLFRHLSDIEARELAKKWSVVVDEMEYETGVGLLHGPLCAHFLRDMGIIKEETILDAIRYHTTGKLDFSRTGIILVISDVLEANRIGDGLSELREIIGEVSLGELYLQSLRYKVEKLRKKEYNIHKRTIAIGGVCD